MYIIFRLSISFPQLLQSLYDGNNKVSADKIFLTTFDVEHIYSVNVLKHNVCLKLMLTKKKKK